MNLRPQLPPRLQPARHGLRTLTFFAQAFHSLLLPWIEMFVPFSSLKALVNPAVPLFQIGLYKFSITVAFAARVD